MSKIKIFIFAVTLAFSCAIFTCFVSHGLTFGRHGESVENQLAILKGEPGCYDGGKYYLSMFQNRILFPSLLNALKNMGFLSTSQWYIVLRIISSFLAFFVFFYLLIKIGQVNYKIASAAVVLLAYEMIFTFNFPWENPTDFLDVTFISSFLWAALSHRRLVLFLLAILAATNRKSSSFAGVIWFFLYGIDNKFRLRLLDFFYAVFISIISYGFALLIRHNYGVAGIRNQQSFTAWSDLSSCIKKFINHPNHISWPVLLLAMSIPIVLWIWNNRKFLSPRGVRLLASALAIFLITLIFGTIKEIRVFIPTIVIMVFVAAVAESKNSYVN